MDFFWWIAIGLVWLALLATVGLHALNKGHTVLFFCGLLVPLLWIVGALLPPTHAARAASARARLH